MSDPNSVDRLYDEATAVIRLLQQGHETSLEGAAADYFRKALLLARIIHDDARLSVEKFVQPIDQTHLRCKPGH